MRDCQARSVIGGHGIAGTVNVRVTEILMVFTEMAEDRCPNSTLVAWATSFSWHTDPDCDPKRGSRALRD